MQFRKAVALKWHSLSPTKKATFFVPSPHTSSATPKTNGDTFKCSGILLTRCSPQRFRDFVSRLSEDQIAAIKEMGFGTLVQLSCTRVRRDLCRSLINNFDTEACTIKLHGKTMKIDSSEFEQIMGVPEGGSKVDLSGSIEDNDVKPLLDFYFGTSENISISDLIQKLEESNIVDDNFRVGFILLALGTLLCPNTSIKVHSKYLIPLRDPRKIKLLNWASFCFGFLVDGVRSFKQNESGYLSGCVLFFQIYYYNIVAHGRTLIDCSKPALAAWGEVKSSNKLLKWISKKGGLESSTINLVSKSDGVEDVIGLRDNVEFLKSVVSRVEKSVEELKDIVVGTVSTKIASELKELLKVLKDRQDTEQKNEDTSANHEDDQHHQNPKESSCEIFSHDNWPPYVEVCCVVIWENYA